MIIAGTFDPITSSEVERIKEIRKNGKDRDVFVTAVNDGILPVEERVKLLKRALAPYRHIHVVSKDHYDMYVCDEEEEKRVRSGYFRLVPESVRRQLFEDNCYLEEIVNAAVVNAREGKEQFIQKVLRIRQ